MKNGETYHIRRAELADVAGIARVQVESWQSTYLGLIPEDVIAKLTYTRRVNQWRRSLSAHSPRRCAFVAENNQGEIVGFASGGAETSGMEGFEGELYAIYILEEEQGKGIGTRLTVAIAKCLFEKGMRSMLVWVLATNPYSKFYENLGGERVAERDEAYAGADLHVRAYGWKDLAALIAKLENS